MESEREGGERLEDDSGFDQTDWQAHKLSKINYDAKLELEPLRRTILIFELEWKRSYFWGGGGVRPGPGPWRGPWGQLSKALGQDDGKCCSSGSLVSCNLVKGIFENYMMGRSVTNEPEVTGKKILLTKSVKTVIRSSFDTLVSSAEFHV